MKREITMLTMAPTRGFRTTEDDERIIQLATREGESATDVIRRALKLLDQEVWLERARVDAQRLADEDLGDEPDAW